MTKTARSPRASARVIPLRRGTTLEMVRLACPDSAQAQRISESFGLAILDSDGIRDLHERLIIETADALKDGLSERAMQIHLQRIVGAYVGSAHGAGQFYTRAVTEARDATAKLANDSRDEDLDGPVGFDSQAQRKREFAADMGVQAHALRMAAEGAVAAYEQVVGETWKPFERPVDNTTATPSAARRPRRRCRRSTSRQRGASAPRLFHCNQPKGRSARPALFRVAAATKARSPEITAPSLPLPVHGPAPDPMPAQRLRRPSRCFGPSGARTLGPAVADPVRGRDGRGLPNGGYDHEQKGEKSRARPLRAHHRPHRRRA